MRGMVTVKTVIWMFIASIGVMISAPLYYGAINHAWSTLSVFEKLGATILVPTLALSLVLVPFNRDAILNIILRRNNKGGGSGGYGGYGGWGGY